MASTENGASLTIKICRVRHGVPMDRQTWLLLAIHPNFGGVNDNLTFWPKQLHSQKIPFFNGQIQLYSQLDWNLWPAASCCSSSDFFYNFTLKPNWSMTIRRRNLGSLSYTILRRTSLFLSCRMRHSLKRLESANMGQRNIACVVCVRGHKDWSPNS